jgi:hypothetical protein
MNLLSKNITRKNITSLVIAICMISVYALNASASICTIIGNITDTSGIPAPSEVPVQIIDVSLGTSYTATTGFGKPNIFVKSFTCNLGDEIQITARMNGETITKTIEFVKYPIETTLVFTHIDYLAQNTTTTNGTKASRDNSNSGNGRGSGGSSGGGSGNFAIPDFGKIVNESNNTVTLGSRLRFYMLGDDLSVKMINGEIKKQGNAVVIALNDGRNIILELNRAVDVDLDLDGKIDGRLELLKLVGETATFRFQKNYQAHNDQTAIANENSSIHAEEPSGIEDSRLVPTLAAILVILAMITALTIWGSYMRGKKK